jgi:uncharacterized SAM-binding protein YcdF (DUF218 family)
MRLLRPGGVARTWRWRPCLARLLRRAAAGLLLVSCGALAAYGAGAYLVVDDPLEPAQAIVVLAGGFPTREWEAAALYRAGLAPRIVLVREWLDDPERRALTGHPSLTDRQALLVQQGVPADAITVPEQPACMTADELEVAAGALGEDDRPAILVTSKYHARRVSVLWMQAAGSRIRGVMRTPSGDSFSPATWWLDRRSLFRVSREYVGLATAGLPLPTRRPPCGQDFVRLVQLLDRLVN